MITVRGTLYLTDVGAHERVYEGVKVDVEIAFTKGEALLSSVVIAEDEAAYIKSVGSTKKHWLDTIQAEFAEGDYVLDRIVEDLADDEYAKAEDYITAYYKDNPMPDGVEVELIPIQNVIDELFEEGEDNV